MRKLGPAVLMLCRARLHTCGLSALYSVQGKSRVLTGDLIKSLWTRPGTITDWGFEEGQGQGPLRIKVGEGAHTMGTMGLQPGNWPTQLPSQQD